jgi:hypothetical protein
MKKQPRTPVNPVLANLRKFQYLIIAIVIIFALAFAYELGYRIGPGLTLARVGTISLTNLPKGASIYTDQTLRGVTANAGTQNEDLVAGSHTVIVSETGDYPWSALVSINSGKTTTADPIFVPMQPNVTPIASTSTAYKSDVAAIASTTLPTELQPLVLENGCVTVYVSANQVVASAATTTPGCATPPAFLCTAGSCSPTIVFAPVHPLTGVFAFPGRQDALVVEFDNTLYALSLDPRSPQFFAPILTGTNPIAGTLSDGTIVVNNNGAVYKVNL